MIIIFAIIVIIHALWYTFLYVEWRNDCKEICKENLAVPLSERLYSSFFYITIPCFVGVLMGLL